jgi:hypothetical protein
MIVSDSFVFSLYLFSDHPGHCLNVCDEGGGIEAAIAWYTLLDLIDLKMKERQIFHHLSR